jgi:hypothetical protein
MWRRLAPPGIDVGLFAALLAANAWTGGEVSRLELHGNALHLSELALVAIALVAVVRVGPRRSLRLLIERGAAIWLAILAVAGIAAGARGLADVGLSATVYDFELLVFMVAVPVVVLVADTRERARWLMWAVVVITAVATVLFVGAEAVARVRDSAQSVLADQEGEIGSGAFYASFALAATLPAIARRSRLALPAFVLACLSLLLIGLADKRSAWVAVLAVMVMAVVFSAGHRRRLLAGMALLAVVLGGSFLVDSATEVDGGGDTRSLASGPAGGPLEGDFENGIGDWHALGGASTDGLKTTADWSAAGQRSLHVEGVADGDGQYLYAFACDCCSEGGGASVKPGARYVASAVIRPDEVPSPGVSVQLVFYPDNGTFERVGSAESMEAAGDPGRADRITVREIAPEGARIVGVVVGTSALQEGQRSSYDIDRVTLHQAGRADERNLECGGGAGEGSQVEREVSGLLGGGSTEGENVSWRLDFWKELMSRLGDQPLKILTGAGFGPLEFVRGSERYDFRISGSDDLNNTSGPHNAFVGVLYEMGILGLAGLVGLLATACLRLREGLRIESRERAMAAALAGMLAVSIAYMCFTESLRAAELALFSWTAVGLCLALWPRRAATEADDRD